MRAKRNILSIVIAVMCVLSITAQEIIPVQESNLEDSLCHAPLKRMITYTKDFVQKCEGKIPLPKEVNVLLKQDLQDTIYANPQWDSLYFEQEADRITCLIVPMRVNTTNGEFLTNLRVSNNYLSYSKMVISDFRLQDKENTEYISIYSNIWGRLIGAAVYDEHMAIKEYVSLEMLGAQDFLTKERDTSKSIYQKNKTVFPIYRRSKVIPSNILKYDDSRPSNNHGVYKQRGSLNLIIY